MEQVLDLLVYAPVGLVMVARDELPKLIERGRSQVQAQATMARLVGQFAVHQGRREAEKMARRASERMSRPPRPEARPQPQPRPAPAQTAGTPTPAAAPPPAPGASAHGNGARPSAAGLAIPGYDALAASQVLPRLAGLSADELEAVRAYETATRHRKTILNRIDQLRSGPTP